MTIFTQKEIEKLKAEAVGRNDPSVITTADSRPAGSQHLTDHRVVVCEKGHRETQRGHRIIRDMMKEIAKDFSLAVKI